MTARFPAASLSLLLVTLLVAAATLSRPAEAGLSESLRAIAPPLAQQFGVPASAVTGLLEGGLSLESVTQLLLVSQSSKSSLDGVTKLYRDAGNDIDKTAKQLDVARSAYSKEKVTAAIDEARASATASAADTATDEANKALDSALGGWGR